MISISYSKILNPAKYQPEADADNYYDQFNDAVLSETITETVTDAEGNILSQKTTAICGKNQSESTTTYEPQTLFTYDKNCNVSQTETKSWKEGVTGSPRSSRRIMMSRNR